MSNVKGPSRRLVRLQRKTSNVPIRIVILAAGKGKRMGSEDLPKVLRPLRGRPMLAYVLDAVRESGIDARPIVVVGHLAEKVKETCGTECAYAAQEELRGTGDAVRSARMEADGAETVMVLNGDMPFVKSATIRRVRERHREEQAVMTMGTVALDDFEGWRGPFADFGRIIRDTDGRVRKIVEVRDADDEARAVMEMNPGIFCFDAAWLWQSLETLTTGNAQGEFYLTDLLEKAVQEGERVATVTIDATEAIGVNTPEQLALAEGMLKG